MFIGNTVNNSWQRHRVLVVQQGGTMVRQPSFSLACLSWELRAAPLHLMRQESFIPLTNRHLPLCISPEVIYTGCCLLWGLARTVICIWRWRYWRFVPLIADSHEPEICLLLPVQLCYSCRGCNLTGHRNAENVFSKMHGMGSYVRVPTERQWAAATWLWVCFVSLHWPAKRNAWTLMNAHSYQCSALKTSAGCSDEKPTLCVLGACFSEGICLHINKDWPLVTRVLREDIWCSLRMPLMIWGWPTIFVLKRYI